MLPSWTQMLFYFPIMYLLKKGLTYRVVLMDPLF